MMPWQGKDAGRRCQRLGSNTISYYKLSFWAAASAPWALAATVRARPPAGRARPSTLHIKKALASKWYKPPSLPHAHIRRSLRESTLAPLGSYIHHS
jgi:hypothetical protein